MRLISDYSDGWLDKPWMFSEPKPADMLKQWRETWITYILKFAENKNIHVINISDLQRNSPFNKLDINAFKNIVTSLIQAGYGKWWNKESKLLRIYWRSLDKWADIILDLIHEKEVKIINGLQGLVELEPQLVAFPKIELVNVLDILVKRKYANWIDRKNNVMRII